MVRIAGLKILRCLLERFERVESESEQNSLGEALKRKLQREINISADVDQSLIGGVIIKAEDTVIDDSVRGRLTKLSPALR